MAKEIFLISDTHFGHTALVEGGKEGGRQSDFTCVDEMNEVMVENWNATVRPTDKIYHLGDFGMKRRALKFAERLNGDKILILGNHDGLGAKAYLKHFRDVRAYWPLAHFGLSHIPVHRGSLRTPFNVHGHLHRSWVRFRDGEPDKRYVNISVEQTGYKPVALDDLIQKYPEPLPGDWARPEGQH